MQLKKKRFSLLFIFNLFILFCIIKSANCSYNEYNCSLPNDCTATSNYPICLDGKCRQCVPTHSEKDCQCPPGDYCISDSLDVSSFYISRISIFNLSFYLNISLNSTQISTLSP